MTRLEETNASFFPFFLILSLPFSNKTETAKQKQLSTWQIKPDQTRTTEIVEKAYLSQYKLYRKHTSAYRE